VLNTEGVTVRDSGGGRAAAEAAEAAGAEECGGRRGRGLRRAEKDGGDLCDASFSARICGE